MKNRSGFTLIELAVVLVIIGLLAAGILVGRDLIEAAKIRATIGQYEQFRTAVNVFYTKYRAYPGDLTSSKALSWGFQPTSRPYGDSFIMHGDNKVEMGETTDGAGELALADEVLLFWRDLSSAGLISGNFTSAVDANPDPGLNRTNVGQYLPAAKIRDSGSYWSIYYSYPSMPSTPYVLSNFKPNANGSIQDWAGLTPTQAYDIDVKLDDGLPNSGNIITLNNFTETQPSYVMPCTYPDRIHPDEYRCSLMFQF